MMRMLIVGYCFGIRSERRLCEEVHLNLAYRWFCRLGLDADVPDHSTFSKNRHGRFRESDLLRKLFETVVARCMKEGIVGGEAFAVDARTIVADAHRRRGVAKVEDLDPTSGRAVAEYLSVLDDAAFGGVAPVEPKSISPTDPATRYTAAANTPAVYAYSDNYLIDLKHAVIMDVEATTAIRQAEVGAAKTMLDPTAEQFDVAPSRLVADAGYGSAEMIGWLVEERGIEPHVKLMDKSERRDGTLSRSDFAFDPEGNRYVWRCQTKFFGRLSRCGSFELALQGFGQSEHHDVVCRANESEFVAGERRQKMIRLDGFSGRRRSKPRRWRRRRGRNRASSRGTSA